MRMSLSGSTAKEFLKTPPEAELIEVIRDFGEERNWRTVGRSILEARRSTVFDNTAKFAEYLRPV
jgi:16S rRNA (cytosine1402-N4)-methyltransferase